MHSLRRLRLLPLCLMLVLAVFALAACSGSQSTPGNEGTSAEGQTGQPAEEQTAPGEEPLYTPKAKVTGDEVAVIKTNKGEIRLKLYAKDAPNHVANFVELAEKKFYDGTKFHRVEPGFVVQGGDPLSKTGEGAVGTGGPGYRLKAEFNQQKHLEGTLAMARSQDPDSAGSQFYIALAPLPSLDGQYTVFGQVVSGMDVVKKIEIGDTMESVTIERGK